MSALLLNRLQEWYLPKLDGIHLSGQTLLLTGANIGLGLAMAKKVASMSPAKLILTGRTEDRLREPLKQIKRYANSSTEIVCMALDLSSTASIKSFAEKLIKETSGRLDIAVFNAAVAGLPTFQVAEGHELTMQVNVYGTLHLFFLLYPLLKATTPIRGAAGPAHAVFVTGNSLPSIPTDFDFLAALDDEEKVASASTETDPHSSVIKLPVHYPASKFTLKACFINLAKHLDAEDVILSSPSPGWCRSYLSRNVAGWRGTQFRLMVTLFARHVDSGATCILWPALKMGKEAHGQYINDCQIAPHAPFFESEEGAKAAGKIYCSVLKEVAGVDSRVLDIFKA